jgi:hypothetical protein
VTPIKIGNYEDYVSTTFLPASQDAGNRIGHVPIILEVFVEFVEF